MRTLVAAFFGILFGAIFTTFAAYAWSGPPGSPTTCPSGSPGCDAPINVGTGTQVKPGNLSVNAFTATQNSLFYGSIGVGSSNAPSYTLDVTGTQRTTGAVTLGSTLAVSGAITSGGQIYTSSGGIKFPDGSVQTLAALFGGTYMESYDQNGVYGCRYVHPVTGSCSCPTGYTAKLMWDYCTQPTSCPFKASTPYYGLAKMYQCYAQ